MSAVRFPASRGQAGRTAPNSGSATTLSTLVYRSRVVEPIAPVDLHRRVTAAPVRNRAESHDGAGMPISSLPVPRIREEMHQGVLRSLVTQVAIPRLVARHSLAPAPLPLAGPQVGELARLLLATDPTEAFERVNSLHAAADSLAALCAHVLEPTARRLGDLWSSDDCSEVDVTIGMYRLQTALRRSVLCKPMPMPSPAALGVVLVAPQPGDLHMLGSVLDAEVLWRAGWRTRCEFPATDQALQDLLAETWFDVLDLSMSLAFRHEHRLARLTRTIRQARQASRNPDLRIVVGGRLFFERPGAGRRVGADAFFGSASQVEALILGAAGKRRPPLLAREVPC